MLPSNIIKNILGRTDRETRQAANTAGLYKQRSPGKPKTLSVGAWTKHEAFLDTMERETGAASKMSPTKTLVGQTDAAGKTTYNAVRTKREFGVFAYIVTDIAQALANTYSDGVDLPSFAVVMPGADKVQLVLHPYENNEDDLDAIEALFDPLHPGGPPRYGVCVLASDAIGMAHGAAYIAWKDGTNKSHLAFYDPLAYKRHRRREDGSTYYDEFEYFPQVLRWVAEEADYSFETHDLSRHCIKRNTEEYDCPQYHMNAEYCYLYSLHFLYCWGRLGKRLTEQGFKDSIEASYIIPPEKLSRAYNSQTLRFRVHMMGFIVSTLMRYLEALTKKQRRLFPNYYQWVQHLETFAEHWKIYYGAPINAK